VGAKAGAALKRRDRLGRRAALAALCLVAAGCATASGFRASQGVERRQVSLDVPFHAQSAMACGAASLAMALEWSGLPADPDDLLEELEVPAREGVLQLSMVSVARRRGRLAYVISGSEELLREVAAGHPVVVLQNLGWSWYPAWHYAVVIGYDLDRATAILHTGTHAAREVPLAVFDRTWARSQRWGLVVLPCSERPAAASEARLLEASRGLERAGQVECARQARAAAGDPAAAVRQVR
jgi:hypothetical protein